MSMPARVTGLPLQQNNNTLLHDYIEVFWRRKWWLILFLGVGLGSGYVVCFFIPTLYQSSTMILVDPQTVPTSYVNSTVSGKVNERLQRIRQQLMSSTNLVKIIRDYNLYKSEETTPTQGKSWPEKIKSKIHQLLVRVGMAAEAPATATNRNEVSDATVARMRRDIDIKFIGKEAFAVSYKNQDPSAAMRVANTLALLFIEENLKVRERQAEGTSEFLESQVAELEKVLQKQESALREFQEKNRGALPAQLDANLRTLDRLQQEIASLNELIAKTEMVQLAEQKKVEEERRMQQELMSVPTAAVPGAKTTPGRSAPSRVEALKQELARLQATFSENYPDVIAVKKQLEELLQSGAGALPDATATSMAQPEVAPADPGQDPAVASSAPVAPVASVPGTSQAQTKPQAIKNINTIRANMAQEKAITAAMMAATAAGRELVALRARRDRVTEQMRQLEAQVAATPANEEKLQALTRDHSTSLKSYHAMLDKRLNAKISENLEKKQKGEQFRVIDPANLPTIPIQPNPPLVVGAGGALGAGLGVGLILLLNYFNPAIRKPEEISSTFGLPLLATIPKYDMDVSKSHTLIVMQEPDSLVAEQFRILYTKINDLSREQGQKIFAITSALQSEGKTVTVLNLAVTMARDFGKRTLILEGDLRRPTIPLYLKVDLEEGLVDVLSSKVDMQATMVPVANTLVPFADENLTVLPAVRRTQNSSSLLSSPRMRDLFDILREQYDYILIDAPPVLPLSDMNIFEEVVDAILLVVRSERTPRGAVLKAIESLNTEKLIGIALNDTRMHLSSYYKYGYGYGYKYTAEKN
ncbi:MAG: GumC family protein [Candidatus Tectimicrobiota bacterium]